MAGLIFPLIRPLLYAFDPEQMHHLSLAMLKLGGGNPLGRRTLRMIFGLPKTPPVEVLGLNFPNRVGLAAGYDKDAIGLRGLSHLGFGHIEIGTVTPRPQPGNPKTRIYASARRKYLCFKKMAGM